MVKHTGVGGGVCEQSEQEEFSSLAVPSARSTMELKYQKIEGCEFRAEKRKNHARDLIVRQAHSLKKMAEISSFR